MHYAITTPKDRPPVILQFHTELDRDEWTSRKPSERRAADAPEDLSGFRHTELHEPAARVLYCKSRAMTEAEVKPVSAVAEIEGLLKEAEAGYAAIGKHVVASGLLGTYPGPNENPPPAEVVARFAETLPPPPSFPPPWRWITEKVDKGMSRGKEVVRYLCGPENGQIIAAANWATSGGEVWQAWIQIRKEDQPVILAAPELLQIARLLAFTGCPVEVLREHARTVMGDHGLA